MAMASDLRIATPRTKTAFLFTRVGLAGCDMGACAILPRQIGQGRASELLFTGRVMTADEGERWGFHNRVVEGEVLMETALELACSLARGPTFAHGITKNQLNVEWDMSLDAAIESEAQAQAILELRLQRLTGLEQDKIHDEFRELLEAILGYLEILGSEARLLEVIREELLAIKEQYGDARRTEGSEGDEPMRQRL
jgi:enoyl-CoA hydratase/carnithine racemase